MKIIQTSISLLAISATMFSCRTMSGSQTALKSDDFVISEACALYEPQGDVAVWVRQYTTQSDLEKIFDCARPAKADRIPLGIGRGFGTVYNEWPIWNHLQTKLGQVIWGGKRFMRDGELTHLINLMVDSGIERYKAKVYVGKSIRDQKDSILLDYRFDDSPRTLGPAQTPVQLLVDKIGPGIRDEIRELYQNGQPTSVFIGRANLYRKVLNPANFASGNMGFPINDEDFAKAENWFMAANFFLDFRQQP